MLTFVLGKYAHWPHVCGDSTVPVTLSVNFLINTTPSLKWHSNVDSQRERIVALIAIVKGPGYAFGNWRHSESFRKLVSLCGGKQMKFPCSVHLRQKSGKCVDVFMGRQTFVLTVLERPMVRCATPVGTEK